MENLNFIKVSCDGTQQGDSKKKKDFNSKHPLIYLKVPFNSKVSCPYCGKVFTYAKQF